MNPDKLELLKRLATNESTPEEEARSAAVLYLRNAPATVSAESFDDATRRAERAEQRLATMCCIVDDIDRKHHEIYDGLYATVARLRRMLIVGSVVLVLVGLALFEVASALGPERLLDLLPWVILSNHDAR